LQGLARHDLDFIRAHAFYQALLPRHRAHSPRDAGVCTGQRARSQPARGRAVSCGPCARVSQTRMVRSTEADANTVASLGLHCRSSTEPSWPCVGQRGVQASARQGSLAGSLEMCKKGGHKHDLPARAQRRRFHTNTPRLRCCAGRCPSAGWILHMHCGRIACPAM